MIDKKLIPYGGLKKEPFSGTHHGMRYFFRGDDGKSRRMLDSVKSILFVAVTCREWKQLISDISIIIDVMMMPGSKGVWPHMIHGLLRISCSRNPTDAYELLRCEAAPAILQTFEIR